MIAFVSAVVGCFSLMLLSTAQGDSSEDKKIGQSESLKTAFQAVEQKISSLKCLPVITDPTKSAESWKGDYFATGNFVWRDKPEIDFDTHTLYRGIGKTANVALRMTIHHYASAQELEKDIERSLFRERQASPEKPEPYQEGSLYRWRDYKGHLVYQCGLYVCELVAVSKDGAPVPMALEALDAIIPSLSK